MSIAEVNHYNGIGNIIQDAPQIQSPASPVTTPPVTSPNISDFGPASVYEPSNRAGYNADISRMRELWADHQQQVDNFRRMLESLFTRQAQEQGLAAGTWNPADIEVTDEMRAAAQAEIEDGGYFSVDATAGRLLDFAVAISGGDPSRIEVLRGAVEQGFASAERMWGGELPEISQRTREAVMNGFDEWAAAGNANAITLLNPAQPE